MNNIIIQPFKKQISTIIDVSNSKSLSLRALILASLAKGKSILKNVLNSTDINDCILVLKSLGIKIENKNNNLEIQGCDGLFPIKKTSINFGSSGASCRFLTAMICASLSKNKNNYEIIANASEQLKKRPIKPLIDTLKTMGANIEYLDKVGYLPIKIKTTKLINTENIIISGKESSQFVSAILMMAPLLEKNSIINIKDIDSNNPYIQMAIESMKYFGVININEIIKNTYSIFPTSYQAKEFSVETDINTACYFLSLTAILGGEIEIKNINKNSKQPALKFLDILTKMGCEINFNNNNIILKSNGKLKGDFIINMFEMAELTTLLSILAVFADSSIEIRNVEHIRNHESNRIFAISTQLKKAGVEIEEYKDGLKITPKSPKYFTAETYNDHRIAMPLAILGVCGNGIEILNATCICKTCPDFFELLNNITKN